MALQTNDIRILNSTTIAYTFVELTDFHENFWTNLLSNDQINNPCLTRRPSVAAASAVLSGPARRLPRKRHDGSGRQLHALVKWH
jgi:hypothetical protein